MKNGLLIFSGIYILAISIISCEADLPDMDAMGSFEAQPVLVSSKASGEIIDFKIEEGVQYSKGDQVGIIDTSILHLQKLQLQARIEAIRQKQIDVTPKIKILKEKQTHLKKEQKRFEALLLENAATQKQVDDIENSLAVLREEIDATRQQFLEQNQGILAEITPIKKQIEIVNAQINDAHIYNPITGRVLLKLREAHEVVRMGQPLYKIASLDTLTLRAYIGALQLPAIQIGQQVTVRIDAANGRYDKLPGTISWISQEAEFTPTTIQTKEERTQLVYAIKISVKNNGRLKIGMPAEVILNQNQ